MKIKYIIEIWDNKRKRYTFTWSGNERYVKTMFNKPYIARYTRRIIKITEEIIEKKARNNWL
jgi:hypothetical protein